MQLRGRYHAASMRSSRSGGRGCRCCAATAMTAQGQLHALPRRSITVRFTPTSRPRQDGLNATLWPSRPGEFHPEPLTDPDLTLSRHPARATSPDGEAMPSVKLYPKNGRFRRVLFAASRRLRPRTAHRALDHGQGVSCGSHNRCQGAGGAMARIGSCVTSIAGPHGVAQLYER